MPNNLNQTAYGEHLRGCADLAIEIADRMNIHDDNARQACFATVIINAERHHIFMEPVPRDTKTPVIQPETAAVESSATKKGAETTAAEKDKQAAEKADAQIEDMPRNPTPETADSARRSALLTGIERARGLLNKEGHVPPITPGGLNAYIKKNFPGREKLADLETDELDRLTMLLSSKLDVLREKKAKATTAEDDELGF